MLPTDQNGSVPLDNIFQHFLVMLFGKVRIDLQTKFRGYRGDPKSDMTDKFKLKVGEALPGFRFKPGECFVNSTWGEEFRQGKSTPKQFDGLTRERGERATLF